MTAKDIYNIIREKPYKDGEQMIIDYALQECKTTKKEILLEYQKWFKENYENYYQEIYGWTYKGEAIVDINLIDEFLGN